LVCWDHFKEALHDRGKEDEFENAVKDKKEFVNLERNCNFKRESRKWKAKDFDTFVKDGEGGWVLLCLESGKKIS
jgi:hypothetical protein